MRINNINNFHIYNNPYKPSQIQQSRFTSFAGWDFFSYEIDHINPVTNQHDSKIEKKEAELIKKGVDVRNHANMIAKAGIDKRTGEYSPYFNKIIRCLLPSKLDDILFKKDKKRMIESYVSNGSWQSDIPDFINSIKDKNGSFNAKNYKLAENLINGGFKNYHLELHCYTKMINKIKDENGIIDDKLASYVEELSINRSVDGQNVVDIIDFIQTQPKEKQENIFNTIIVQAPANKRIDSEKDFIIRSQFCFDENGDEIKENTAIVSDIYKLCPDVIFPDIEILNLYKNSPQFKTILNIIMRNDDGSFNQCYEKVKKHSKNNDIDVTTINRMLAILPFDSELSSFESIIKACTKEEDAEYFDDERFKRIINVYRVNKSVPFQHSLSKEETIKIISEDNPFENLSIKEKLNIYERMKYVYNFSKAFPNSQDYDFLQEKITSLEKSLSNKDFRLDANKEIIDIALNTIFKANDKNTKLTDFEVTIKTAIPKLKKYKNGLPLKYNRNDFLKDINVLVQKNPEAKNVLVNKWGFTLDLKMPECFTVKQQNAEELNPIEKEVDSLINKFLYENEIQTKDAELNKQLNILIKAFPEFISMIGREQHGTHAYTVDVHSLLVLAEAIRNPKYQGLNATDKETLKTIALFHDISKKEKEIDKEHPAQSAICTKSILRKTNKTEAELNRIYELIKNHSFLEMLDKVDYTTPMERKLAFYFRRPNDFEIAKILTESDLKSVNDYFYEANKSKLSEKSLKGISNNIIKLQGCGNAIFPSYIVDKNALNKHKQVINGKEYIIINTHDFGINEDLSEYGFEEGTKKQDLSFLVHMTDRLNTLEFLKNSASESVLSESFITPLHKKTYADKKYGVFLKHNNYDIINMARDNQASGRGKEIKNILSRLFDDNTERATFVFNLLHDLGINNYYSVPLGPDFSTFYNEVLSNITSLNGIEPKRNYHLGKRAFTGESLISSLKKTQKELLHKTNDLHNEILGYAPEIQGVIAKEKDPNKLPTDILDFAYENNYPIVLI